MVSLIEDEQKILKEQIDDVRNELKVKTSELLKIQPALTDMDPFVVKLLLQQQGIERKKATKTKDSSEDEDDEELNID